MDRRMQGNAVRRREGYESSVYVAAEHTKPQSLGEPPIPEYYGTEVGEGLGLDANTLPRMDPLTRIKRHG